MCCGVVGIFQQLSIDNTTQHQTTSKFQKMGKVHVILERLANLKDGTFVCGDLAGV
jgi:hypothetical protein